MIMGNTSNSTIASYNAGVSIYIKPNQNTYYWHLRLCYSYIVMSLTHGSHISADIFIYAMRITLLLSGDIELNPGPANTEKNYQDLAICHLNMQSMKSDLDKVKHIKLQLTDKFDIITVSETWLTSSIPDKNYQINGYHNIFRKDRNVADIGGGVAAWVSCSLSVKRRKDLELLEPEVMWLEVRSHNNKFLLCVVYRPPKSTMLFWDDLQQMLDMAKSGTIQNIIMMGDFNADEQTYSGNHLDFFIAVNHLTSHINEPTRITSSTQTKLDKILTNIPQYVKSTEVLTPLLYNDHSTVAMSLLFRLSRTGTFKRTMWDYTRADLDGLKTYMANFDWLEVFNDDDDIDTATANWSSKVLEIANSFIPNKVVTIRPNDKAWYNGHLRKLRRSCERAHRFAKNNIGPDNWARYRHIRNNYIQECRNAEKQYESIRLQKIRESSFSTKECWNLYKSVLNIHNKPSIPTLLDDDTPITDDKDKANVFNEFFLSNSQLDDSNTELPESRGSDTTLDQIEITIKDVSDQISLLDITKAYGPDNISPRLLKLLGETVVSPLYKLFNMSLKNKKVPRIWKQANVIPIFKKGDPTNPTNYRPVSLLNTTSKILEKIIFKYVFNYFRDNFLISIWQSGFLPGCSTVSQLIEIYHKFCSAVNNGREVRVVFLDISKAFDRVWHKGLIHKLQNKGITGNLLEWFKDYLTDRQQRVCINGQTSTWGYISAGVPQGSVLGPLLFLIFIDDLTDAVLLSDIRLYADDTCLFITVNNRQIASDVINNDLKAIQNWADKWLVSFSAPKTKSLIISNKHNLDDYSDLQLNNTPIQEVTSHKHLGIVIAKNLWWREYINEVYCKAMKRLDIIQAFKYKLDRQSLEKYYISFVRPLLEYADVVWSGAYDCDLVKLEKVQVRAMRIITGATEKSNILNLYRDTGWAYLQERREIHKLIWFYKIINNMAPPYLTELLPPTVEERSDYNLRSRKNISQVSTRLETFSRSFFPCTIKLWNLLPPDLRNIQSLELFTKLLKHKYEKKSYPWYNIGNRFANIHHARLRIGCSMLNAHLFYNLVVIDSPSCRCGHSCEDPQHYFFECRLYRYQRENLISLLTSYLPVTLELLLYGNENLSFESNREITLAVHNYIIETKRFCTN